MAQNPLPQEQEPLEDPELEEQETEEELDDDPLLTPDADEDLDAQDAAAPANDLEDLFAEATATRVAKQQTRRQRISDPALRDALDATAKKMRELYTDPNNWKQGRGLVLIDKETKTVLGNFHEYLHKQTSARKLVRAHEPIEINGQEEIEGWLGHERAAALHGITWDKEVAVTVHVQLDEIQVDAPAVPLTVCLQFNTIVRCALAQDTQFASASGNVLLRLEKGTDVWTAAGTDTKAAIRKAVL